MAARDQTGDVGPAGLRDPMKMFQEAVGSTAHTPTTHPPGTHPSSSSQCWTSVVAPALAEPLASLLAALADTAEQTMTAGGSVDEEPYLSAVAVARLICEPAAQQRPWPR